MMTVTAKMHFLDPAHTRGPVADLDLRTLDYEPDGRDMTEVQVMDASILNPDYTKVDLSWYTAQVT